MVKNETLYTLLINNDLDSLEKALEDDIREESVKGNKKAKSQLSILKKLFKVRKGTRPSDIPTYVGKAIQIDKGLYGFMSPYHFFISENDFGYKIVNAGDSGYFELSNLINSVVYNPYTIVFSDDDITNLKLKIKSNKAIGENKPFIIEYNVDCYAGFNPQFLLDAIEFTGTNRITIKDSKTPCYFMSDESNGAVILPIYLKDNRNYKADKNI